MGKIEKVCHEDIVVRFASVRAKTLRGWTTTEKKRTVSPKTAKRKEYLARWNKDYLAKWKDEFRPDNQRGNKTKYWNGERVTWRQYQRLLAKHYRDTLHDCYVRARLKNRGLPFTQDFIEVERERMRLERLIKQRIDEKHN